MGIDKESLIFPEALDDASRAQEALREELGLDQKTWDKEYGPNFERIIAERPWWLNRSANTAEGQEEDIRRRLQEDILTVARDTGTEISEEEVSIATDLSCDSGRLERALEPIDRRAVQIAKEIDDIREERIPDSDLRRTENSLGAQRLVLRAAHFARLAPRAAELLLEYARMINEEILNYSEIKEPEESGIRIEAAEAWREKRAA